tara:strand:- start:3703 stop:3861 length:159 start_codon:yes stop_codon:yes gene_type:complete
MGIRPVDFVPAPAVSSFSSVAAVGAGNWRKPLFPVVGATGERGTPFFIFLGN